MQVIAKLLASRWVIQITQMESAVPIAAAAMGANVIEKHFTLDRKMLGPDHKSSLEQDQFSLMVKSIREVEQALGTGIKRPTASELSLNMSVARKSLVASKPH